MTRSAEADRLIHYMPLVIRAPGLSDKAREFCATIIARDRRGAFTPSAGQMKWMRDLVDQFQAQVMDE